jgi:hypothetical protein
MSLNLGEPNSCEDIIRRYLKDLGVGELCSGSGLSVSSLVDWSVATGVKGEAVGRLGERCLVAGLLASSLSDVCKDAEIPLLLPCPNFIVRNISCPRSSNSDPTFSSISTRSMRPFKASFRFEPWLSS